VGRDGKVILMFLCRDFGSISLLYNSERNRPGREFPSTCFVSEMLRSDSTGRGSNRSSTIALHHRRDASDMNVHSLAGFPANGIFYRPAACRPLLRLLERVRILN
jgi:hypothetical protein